MLLKQCATVESTSSHTQVQKAISIIIHFVVIPKIMFDDRYSGVKTRQDWRNIQFFVMSNVSDMQFAWLVILATASAEQFRMQCGINQWKCDNGGMCNFCLTRQWSIIASPKNYLGFLHHFRTNHIFCKSVHSILTYFSENHHTIKNPRIGKHRKKIAPLCFRCRFHFCFVLLWLNTC